MGEAINHFFESQQMWIYDNGVFWFSGRDVLCFIDGFIFAWCLCYVAAYLDERRKK